MTFFSEYIKSIMTVGICAFLTQSVCNYFTKNKTTTKGLTFITNLCVFTVAIFPLFSFIFDSPILNFDIPPTGSVSTSENTLIELTEKETENKLKYEILQNTGILPTKISIQIEYKENEITITCIDVTVEKKVSIEPIREYLNNSFGENSGIEFTVNTHEQN